MGLGLGNSDGVKHAVTIEEMVRASWVELGVGAVADVSTAMEAAREGALYHLTHGGGKLVDWSEVARKHMIWVDGGWEWKAYEVVDEIVQ